MARLVAVLALFACIAIALAAEVAEQKDAAASAKKEDLQTAAGHLFGYGYGFYPHFYKHFYGFYPHFGHFGFYG